MKKVIAWSYVLCLIFTGSSYAQTFSIELKKASLYTALRKITNEYKKKTGIDIPYSLGDEPWDKYTSPISFKSDSTTLEQALEVCFKSQPFTYRFRNDWITIVRNDIRGTVVNENGEPQPFVTVTIKNTSKQTLTNTEGEFVLEHAIFDSVLLFTSVSTEPFELKPERREMILVRLKTKITELSDIEVDNGYQTSSMERRTNSVSKVDKKLFNRRSSFGVLERIDGVVPGLLFNRNLLPNTNQPPFSIRGRSTIFANPVPLIVVDNFPFKGDINAINPNDIESITILKDAAAAAIYGAASGNGVLVITLKKGKLNQRAKVTVNFNFGFRQKQDLKYLPQLGASDFIDVESYLFNNGYYDEAINQGLAPLHPVTGILEKVRKGELSNDDATLLINTLRGQDIRDEYEKWFQRAGNLQQYAVSVDGGSNNNRYIISIGYDKNLTGQERSWNDRKTAMLRLAIRPARILEISGGANVASMSIHNNHSFPSVIYRYGKLADKQGNALPAIADLSQAAKDSIGVGLSDWTYRPLEEFSLRNNSFAGLYIRVSLGAKIRLNENFEFSLDYLLNKEFTKQQDLHDSRSYFTRNLVNTFSEKNQGGVTYHIPQGDIMDWTRNEFHADNGRAQLNFRHDKSTWVTINAIAGFEVRALRINNQEGRLYGMQNGQPGGPVDFNTAFPVSYNPSDRRMIPGSGVYETNYDRFLSWYSDGAFSFRDRYLLTLSGRIDKSNLFGASTNQKTVVLWSAGLGWNISNEMFYTFPMLPTLKLRGSFGYNGNVDNTLSAYTTAIDNPTNRYGAPSGSIINPGNNNLRWERVALFNIAVDFATNRKKVEGSIEFYKRIATDLIGDTYLDPTSGNQFYRGNSAKLGGHGFDFNLTTRVSTNYFEWTTDIIFSHTTDRIKKYDVPKTEAYNFTDPAYLNPRSGWPVNAIAGYRSAGLDPVSGDPQGFINNGISKDYLSIVTLPAESLVYVGHANPTIFGSIRNTFRLTKFELSFLITGKGGYYFRKYFNYSDDASFQFNMYPEDFKKRWQKPGDEATTSVPSMRFPAQAIRNSFYLGSTATVEKGDHLRLQDIRISYDLTGKLKSLRIVQGARLYINLSNIGLLWTATNADIDPDYLMELPDSRTFNIGLNAEF